MSGLAEATIRANASFPGKTLLTSEGLGWTSLLVQVYELPSSMDPFETLAIPDPKIVLLLNKTTAVQQFTQGTWKETQYGKGMGCVYPPGGTRRLRWILKNPMSFRA